MYYCGECGAELKCESNDARIFSGDLKKIRHTDAFLCRPCDHMILVGHGGWMDTSIEEISLKERYKLSLLYEHWSAVEKRPVCAECRKTMNYHGEGILLLSDEHAHQYGKLWVCPHCDYIFFRRKHTSWPPPLTLDEKRELEEQYAPNIVKIGTGLIPRFESIVKAERKEGSGNPHLDFLIKRGEEQLKKYEKESAK
jgi:DNA-directed RNA polymerase subunit RPC12/RpoP